MNSIIKGAYLCFLLLAISTTINAQIEGPSFQQNNLSYEKEIRAYHYASPNPFSEYTNICFSSREKTTYRLIITNKFGQQVIFKNGEVKVGDNRVEIFRSDLPEGKYHYRLIFGQANIKTGRLYIVG